MEHLGFSSCKADPDVWYCPAVHPNGMKIYEYILLYVDDVLAICVDPKAVLGKIDYYFQLKPGSILEPNIYLGAKICWMVLLNRNVAWAQSSSHYCQEAVRNCETLCQENG